MSILNITGTSLPIIIITILSSFSNKPNTTKNSIKLEDNKNPNKSKQDEPTKKNKPNNNSPFNSKAGDEMKSVNKKTTPSPKTIKSNSKKKKSNFSNDKKLTDDTKDILKLDLEDNLINQCSNLEISEIGKLLISSSALLQNNLAIYLKAETNKIEKLLSFMQENSNKEISVEELLKFKTSVMDSMRSLEEIETQLNKKIKTGIKLIKMNPQENDFNSTSDDD